ncbi:Rhodanese-like protein [Thozetella sp. PMI_491]|nr:Rhodanese-like protein [Thozetella sp. PMI_491]
MASAVSGSGDAAPWHAAYPSPSVSAAEIVRESVLDLLRDTTGNAVKDFVLIDVRRDDHKGGTIRGSINLPAQSLWPSIPTIYQIFKAAGVRKVIWYCGSSGGRGTRTGGWFADHIADQKDKTMESLILVGGIKGWVKTGGEYLQWMDEFDEGAWDPASS